VGCSVLRAVAENCVKRSLLRRPFYRSPRGVRLATRRNVWGDGQKLADERLAGFPLWVSENRFSRATKSNGICGFLKTRTFALTRRLRFGFAGDCPRLCSKNARLELPGTEIRALGPGSPTGQRVFRGLPLSA